MTRLDLVAAAGYYHQIGMNITCIIGCKDSVESFKAPDNKDWKEYFSTPQTTEYILGLNWDNATGVGLVLGYGGYRAIDIDEIEPHIMHCVTESNGSKQSTLSTFIKECLTILKLPSDYPWVVRSGSGTGIHIIFKTKELDGFDCKSWAFSPLMTDDGNRYFKRFELRWEDHLVLAPSLHKTGGEYMYVNTDFPKTLPEIVEIDDINNFINHYSLRVQKESFDSSKQKNIGRYIHFRRGEIVKGSWENFSYCDVEDNVTWLNECYSSKALLQLGVCHMFNRGGAKGGVNKAVEYFKKANIPEAYYNIAYLMATGYIKTTMIGFEETLSKCSSLFTERELKSIKEVADKYMNVDG